MKPRVRIRQIVGETVYDVHHGRRRVTSEGRETACAGWLAVEGAAHVSVRLAVVTGHLDVAALAPGEGWPQLYPSFLAMAQANGMEAAR